MVSLIANIKKPIWILYFCLVGTAAVANTSWWSEGGSNQVSAYNVSFTGGASSAQSDQLFFQFYTSNDCTTGGISRTFGTAGVPTMTFDRSRSYTFYANEAYRLAVIAVGAGSASGIQSIQIQPKINNTFTVWGGATCSVVNCSSGTACIASNSVQTTLLVQP